jgi:hypothetical protein
VVAWLVPLVLPRCHSASIIAKVSKVNFLEFFAKLYFRGFSEFDKSGKKQKNCGRTMKYEFKTKTSEGMTLCNKYLTKRM